jgi:excisionase family DNA binding protein
MSKILTLEEAAAAINRPAATLRYWLVQGTGPRSFKLGRRRMFREEDVTAWVEAQYAEQQN